MRKENIGDIIFMLFLGFLGYAIFFYESPELQSMREECAKKGTTVEKRRNAIQTHILPFAAENYHYACKGYTIFGNKQ